LVLRKGKIGLKILLVITDGIGLILMVLEPKGVGVEVLGQNNQNHSVSYFQSQIKVAAMIRNGVSFSSIGDKFLASKLYFLYMFI
jgi:hypothetical protein